MITDIFTNNYNFIKKIPKGFTIRNIYSEKKLLKKRIKKVKILNSKSIKKISINKNFLGLVYDFRIIFKKEIIKSFKFGIINIHPGNLPKYRGRNPIVWAFLNNEKKIEVTSHLINDQIDRGYLLLKKTVRRSHNDNIKDIIFKINKVMPEILKKTKKNLLNKKFKKISKGNYWPRLKKNYFKIEDSKKHSDIYIFNLIKSQQIFGGVEINKVKIIDAYFFKKKN